jgi:hypothetical protein
LKPFNTRQTALTEGFVVYGLTFNSGNNIMNSKILIIVLLLTIISCTNSDLVNFPINITAVTVRDSNFEIIKELSESEIQTFEKMFTTF